MITQKAYRFLGIALLSLVIYGCSQTRRLEDGQYLLTRNKVVFEGSSDKISGSELDYLIKQKPNRKIFKYPFNLFIHNLPNREKVARKMAKRQLKCDTKNLKRQVQLDSLTAEIDRSKATLKGKKGRDSTRIANDIYRLEMKKIDLEDKMEYCKPVLGYRMMYSIGEEPSLLDSAKMKTSENNINVYLFKKGYFNNEVRSEVVFKGKKKAEVIYTICLDQPYKVKSIAYKIQDRRLAREIKNAEPGTLLSTGQNLDFNLLDKERDRLTTHLRDIGYHFFSKEFIYFEIDTTVGANVVDLTMGVKNILKSHPEIPDSLIEVPHQRYTIAEIFVNTDFDPSIANSNDKYKLDAYDTIIDPTDGIQIIYHRNKGLTIKPKTIVDAIYIKRAYYYRSKEVEYTFRKLSSLGVFRTINIQFEVAGEDPTGNYLNCYINLSRLARQSISLESNGTHRGGNLGVSGNFTYRNRNTFRGAETFRFSMSGGLEAQQVLANEDQTIVGRTFNTLEFGPEVALYIPKFISPIHLTKFDKSSSPRTVFTASLNYQDRPDFVRTIQNVSYAYEWKKGKNLDHLFYLSPVKLSAVKINPDSGFTARLQLLNDQFLLNSYRDHFIVGNQFRYEYNPTGTGKVNRNSHYFKVALEQSGNLMRLGYEMAGMHKDSIGRIFGIQFAQFLKLDVVYRFNQVFNKSSMLVYRVAGGVGLPQRNFNQALPFEKSFFIGGSNGLRGWKARTLGPGSYMGARTTFDRIGDVYLEGNLEYRFDLFGFFKGALFADAGNIWNLRENPARPGSQFTTKFYQDLALDGGVGFRFDLDFFILRFDFAIPLREPGLMTNERWIFQEKPESNAWLNARGSADYRPRVNINLGIGYPF